MSKGIFITGTGTDIGKTYVTGLIVKKLRESGMNAAYYKAAMSGNERRADGSLIPGDALQVKTMSGIGQPLEEMCPYVYETAVSPHLASRLEGNPVLMERVLEDFLSTLHRRGGYPSSRSSKSVRAWMPADCGCGAWDDQWRGAYCLLSETTGNCPEGNYFQPL